MASRWSARPSRTRPHRSCRQAWKTAAGAAGFARVANADLDDFAGYMVQDLEQAARSYVVLSTAAIIIIILLLIILL